MPFYDTQTRDQAILANEPIGRTQRLTPEGFLLCEGVRIARTGSMVYGDGEIPIDPGKDGLIEISRDSDELFSPDTIASFEGKPVTNDHPPVVVTPDNWRKYAGGSVHNVRRGDGAESHYLLADMLITDRDVIDEVRSGKKQVSCGYDADYEQLGPGRGVQRQIIGNHIALVDAGRCGPRCAIGDQDIMAKVSWRDRLLAAFGAGDRDKFVQTLDDAPDDENHIHIHMPETKDDDDLENEAAPEDYRSELERRIAELEAKLSQMTKETTEDEAPGETEEEEKEEKDDEEEDEEGDQTRDSLSKVLALAEILAPGSVKGPTLDAKASKKMVRDAACSCKRQALKAALTSDKARASVEAMLGRRSIDSLKCATLDTVFRASAELQRVKNNGASSSTRDDTAYLPGRRTSAEINQANRDFWSKRGVKY